MTEHEIERLKLQLKEQDQQIEALHITLSWVLFQLQEQGFSDVQQFLARQTNELDQPGSAPLVAEFDALSEHVAFLSGQAQSSQEK